MILEFIRFRLLRTKKSGVALIPMALVMLVLLIVLLNYVYRINVLQYNYEDIDTALTDSLLAAAVVNLDELGESGTVMIQEDAVFPSPSDSYFLNSYGIFLKCLKINLALDDGFNVTKERGIKGQVKVREYRIYNYIETDEGFYITETGITGGNGYSVTHGINEAVYVKANDGTVEITETSVYAKIEFRLVLSGKVPWTELGDDAYEKDVTLTRLIAVTH